jgi:hypothetical protein
VATVKHPKNAGLEHIKVLRTTAHGDAYVASKKRCVGAFGIMQEGFANKIFWVVGERKDKRYGVIDKPAPKDMYCAELFEAMFRRW